MLGVREVSHRYAGGLKTARTVVCEKWRAHYARAFCSPTKEGRSRED
jgi:hypothetical protein